MEIKSMAGNGGKGTIEWVWLRKVICKRYKGEFLSKEIQALAETGLWYTTIFGNPFVPKGEGRTPELAIDDAIERAEDLINKIQMGIEALKMALTKEDHEGTN